MSDDQAVLREQEEFYPDPAFKEMVDAGVLYGRKRSKTNPRMRPFILTTRNEIEIVNLAKTKDVLEQAAEFIVNTVKNGGTILFVGTQPAGQGVVALAQEFGFPYVSNRWIGGTLTNFKVIESRISHFKKLKADSAKGVLAEKYTKKERLEIERDIARYEESMGGLEVMGRLPDGVVVIDPEVHTTAVREAKLLRIPVVAFASTDSDPDDVKYPVVGNSKARLSITWFLDKVRAAVAEGKKQAVVAAEAREAKKEQV